MLGCSSASSSSASPPRSSSSAGGSQADTTIPASTQAALGLSAAAAAPATGPEAAFEKVSCIGEGAFGAVWFARRRRDGLHVALKEVPRSRVALSENLARHLWAERAALYAVAEARAAGEGDDGGGGGGGGVSPALIGALASYASAASVCLVMDLVEGAPLHEHLRRAEGGRLGEAAARWYTAEVAGALQWLHSAGWLYRDLKLSNVMVQAGTGRARLVDFGFAKKAERTSTVVGTLFAMAPEVIRCATGAPAAGAACAADAGSPGYDRLVDWWALGVFLYELLVGTAPFGYHDDVHLEGAEVLEKQARAEEEGLPWPGETGDASGGAAADARGAAAALLVRDSARRLGVGGLEEFRGHAAFSGLDWAALSLAATRGPPFDERLGFTAQSAAEERRRPRRAAPAYISAEVPDPFAGF